MTHPVISALERASEGSRELDGMIALAANVVPKGAFKPCADPDPGTWGIGAYTFWRAPNFSTSLDAAVLLIPEGWTRSVDATLPEAGITVELYSPVHDPPLGLEGDHASEAVATCIVALKAINAMRLHVPEDPQPPEQRVDHGR